MCFECGQLCLVCEEELQRICQGCHDEYCIEHDDECTLKYVRNVPSCVQSSTYHCHSVPGVLEEPKEVQCWRIIDTNAWLSNVDAHTICSVIVWKHVVAFLARNLLGVMDLKFNLPCTFLLYIPRGYHRLACCCDSR